MNRRTWQEDLTHNITTALQLANRNLIKSEQVDELQQLIDIYPMSITEYYLGLIERADETDPIYRMAVASLHEASEKGRFDTSGELSNTVADGIQHKYDNTVLLLSTNRCAMYCRHCFRKRLVGQSEEEILTFLNSAISYINQHPEVDNVLISGGDALLNSNSVIEKYLSELCKNPNIKYIRFGSRTPVVLPSRITSDEELLSILAKYGKQKQIYVVTQFNHPKELTREALAATDALRKIGVPILNQTVLLAGVNDNTATLVDLFNSLVENGITPYYLFQCRPVKGVKGYFALPLLKAVEMVDEVRFQLSGLAKRFRFAMSHVVGKIEILGKSGEDCLIMKQHQAKNNDDLNKIFKVKLEPTSTWLPDVFDKQEV